MNQVKYLLTASILIALLAIGFFVVNLISSTDVIGKKNVVVDFDNTVDVEPVLSNKGKTLIQQNCASCHSIHKNISGPALLGVEEKEPWTERKILIAWIKNPSLFMDADTYTKALQKEYGMTMPAFPNLTDDDIVAILDYIKLQSGTVPDYSIPVVQVNP